MVPREAELELCLGGLEIVLAVRETAAAYHQIAQMGIVRLSHMLIWASDYRA